MAHSVSSEHEMSSIPSRNTYTAIANGENAHVNASDSEEQCPTKLRDRFGLLRHFRFQVFASIPAFFKRTRRHANAEHQKVAMHKNRGIAAMYSLLHVIPLAGAIVLLVLQWTGCWVSDTDNYSTSLQFAAKAHELSMQASLVEVLLCLIRTRLVHGLLPLGALSCAMQATQLSYLWSLDFFSIFQSRAVEGWKRVVLVVGIPLIVSLISVVGPSSAVLMIPRPNSPGIASSLTKYAWVSESQLYPSHIKLVDMPELDFPRVEEKLDESSQYNDGVVWVKKGNLTTRALPYQDRSITPMDRVLQSSRVQGLGLPSDYDPYTGKGDLTSESNATIPTEFAGKDFLDLRESSGDNLTREFEAPHVVVSLKCLQERRVQALHMESKLSYIQDDGKTRGELPELQTILESASDATLRPDLENITVGVWLGPIFIPSPEPESRSTVVVLWSANAKKPNTTISGPTEVLSWASAQLRAELEEGTNGFNIRTCSVSAYWTTSTTRFTSVKGAGMSMETDASSLSAQNDAQQITLDFSGANTLSNANLTHYLHTYYDLDLASILALVLSRKPLNLSSTIDVSFDLRKLPGYPVSDPIPYSFRTTHYGFGYATRSTSIYLAMVVITAYCVITISYILYSIITGSASSAWNSGIELFTLALQSRKPDYIGHTSVGINSVKTFREGVGIRVNKNDELEVVFANDRDFGMRELRKIDKNKAY